MSTPPNQLMRVSLQLLVGVGVGIASLAGGTRLTYALSRAAVFRHVLRASWLQTGLVAWAAVSLVAGLLIGILFRRQAFLPALVSALVPPIFYVCAFVGLYTPDGAYLVGYALEAIVLLLVLPSTAYFIGHRYGG